MLPWRGATSRFAHVALLTFVFLPWKQGHYILLYMWKAPSTFALASLLFTLFFSVQSSKEDLLSDQFVLVLDFLLASNFVSHWLKLLFCFLNWQTTTRGKLIDRCTSIKVFPHRKITTWRRKAAKKLQEQAGIPFEKRWHNLEIQALTTRCNRSPAAFPLLSPIAAPWPLQP